MKLRHGVRFVHLEEGTIWELRTNNGTMGLWACRAVRPPCSMQECPLQVIREFTEEEILQYPLLEPFTLRATNIYKAEMELLHIISDATELMPLPQKRALYLALERAIKHRLDAILSQIGIPDES